MMMWTTGMQNFWVSVAFTLLHMATTTLSTRMHNIHWNASNPLFRIDRTDNVIDINGGNHPWEYDQVNIVCPVYKSNTRDSDLEEYIIYSVSKEEYESCRITQANPKIIALCNRPHELMYFTITFRSFTPTPGGLEFHPGHDYYFISTSSKGDLHRRVGGSCSTHNMKVVFKVAPNSSPDSDFGKIMNTPRSAPPAVEFRPMPIDPPRTQFHPLVESTPVRRYHYPRSELSQRESDNEVVKQDSLHSSSVTISGSWMLVASVVVLFIGGNCR